MSRLIIPTSRFRPLVRPLLVLGLLAALLYKLLVPAYGVELGPRSMKISSGTVSAAARYELMFTLSTTGTLGSISIQFCSNDPIPANPCVAPNGFDAGAAALISQSGQTGFSISGASTANRIILTRPPAAAGIGQIGYTFDPVTNPSSAGSYYVRLLTYATADASGPASDYGGVAYAVNNNLSISAEVPPFLIFCTGVSITGLDCANATGDYINFGEFSSRTASQGSSQMLTATNAQSGYTITVSGTTLTSGNNVIAALAGNDVSRPGTAQFGLNLRANAAPSGGTDPTGPGTGLPTANYNQPNFYRFDDGEIVVATTEPDNVREYTASYIVNVPSAQAPGVYVTTLTYVCLATF